MLDHVPGRVPPIIKSLAAQYMPANSPDRLVVFLREPLVAQSLGVIIVDLETTMVDVMLPARRRTGQENRVMIDQIVAKVDVSEHGDFLPFSLAFRTGYVEVEDVGGYNVEVLRVPVHFDGKLLHYQAEVAELENLRRTWRKALKLSLSWLVRLIIEDKLFGRLVGRFGHRLPLHEVDWKSFWIFHCNELATSWGTCNVLNALAQHSDIRDS